MSDIGSKIMAVLPGIEQIAEVALNIAKVMPVSSSVIAGIELGIKIANGIANEEPIIRQTYEDIKAAAAGGVAVTDEQWAAWQTQVDGAHADFLAAAAKVEAQPDA